MIFSQILSRILSISDATPTRRIVPAPVLSLVEGFLAGFPVVSLSILSVWIFTSCGSQKQVSVITHVARDTLYLNKLQYDSVYIYQSRDVDFIKGIPKPSSLNPQPDTVLIREVATEYRYRLLHDTVRIVRVDTIPIIKEVEVIRTERITFWQQLKNGFNRFCGYIILTLLLILLLILGIGGIKRALKL